MKTKKQLKDERLAREEISWLKKHVVTETINLQRMQDSIDFKKGRIVQLEVWLAEQEEK